jgi:putative transposase
VQWRCQLQECNGEPDHVHLLVEAEPTTPLTKLINNFQNVSSRLLRRDYGAHLARHYRKPALWSPSYCLISCGGAPLQIIKQYIRNQAGAD